MILPALSRLFLQPMYCDPPPIPIRAEVAEAAEGDWKSQVKGVSKDKIDINLVFSYDLELIMDPPPPSKVKAGDTIDIKAHLVSNGQKRGSGTVWQYDGQAVG